MAVGKGIKFNGDLVLSIYIVVFAPRFRIFWYRGKHRNKMPVSLGGFFVSAV